MLTIGLTPEDALAAVAIKRRRMFTGKSGLIVWGGTAVGVFVAAINVLVGPRYGVPSFGFWVLGFYAFAWSLLAVNDFLILPLVVKRLHRRMGLERNRFLVEWDDQGIACETTKGRTITPWADFSEWYQNENIFMLFRKNGRYFVFPKHGLGQESQTDLRHQLEQRIGREGKCAWSDQRWDVSR